MRLHVVRHAECYKNLAEIPGGEGTPLTQFGVSQAHHLGKTLRNSARNTLSLIVSPPRQTLETANIVGEHLGLCPQVEPLLGPIQLGVLNGIPIAEARALYLQASASMDRWRSGSAEIAELKIEGMECPWEFYKRGLQAILKYQDCKEIVLCTTTSVMILITHIANRRTPEHGDGYRSLSFDNSETVTFDFDQSDLAWIRTTQSKADSSM